MFQQRYLVALIIIAVLVVGSQIIVQIAISKQQDDSRVVNISGRQRMLSQKISKDALSLYESQNTETAQWYVEELEETYTLWEWSYHGLRQGDETLGLPGKNSPEVEAMYDDIEMDYRAILSSAKEIVKIASEPEYEREEIWEQIQAIENHEGLFLEGMDKIVFQYDHESKEKIRLFRIIELALMLITLLTLAGELIFIFRPAKHHIEHSLGELEQSREVLQQHATLDEMTDMFNKRTGMMLFQSLFSNRKREGDEMCVGFLDLDGLKAVNDTFGHEAGDHFIQSVAKAIKNSAGSGDILFRYGGDEFVWVFDSCDKKTARLRILKSLERLLRESVGKPYRMYFSFGIVSISETSKKTPEEMLSEADQQMYVDKEKNRQKRREIGG